MQITNRLFSYPIYSEDTDDYRDNQFQFDYRVSSDSQFLSIDYQIRSNNKKINVMIEKEILSVALLIECAKTLFREKYTLDNLTGHLDIPMAQIAGNIDLCCLIIANNGFLLDSSFGLNSDYGKTMFKIEEGYIVGYDNSQSISVDKNQDELFKPSSIISVVLKKDADDSIDIDLNKEKRINITMNQDMFNEFKQIQSASKLPIVHSMIVLPALVYVIDQIKEEKNRQEYEDYSWYISIIKQLEKLGITLDGNQFQKKSSLVIAQELLKSPIMRALKVLVEEEE